MKITIEQIQPDQLEELLIRCHDPNSPWAARVMAAASPEVTVTGYIEDAAYCLPIRELYYFEVVDGKSFAYAEKTVYECRLRLYEFEKLVEGHRFFRCSKSMVLNASRIDHIKPSFSGRFTATLRNGEKVDISRQYVGEMRKQLGL
ncbi:MAG: LytTR family DNA-binding domain-containing protein [Clostridia bacterium]|nr:LytTR family DNA-binding domain-containing protein [Clostridia bacterium]